jgi:hypothetical protein
MVEPGRAATAKGAVSVDVVLSSAAAAASEAKKAHTVAQPRQSATPNAMGDLDSNSLRPIGVVRSPLEDREKAPNQGSEGAPEAWIELTPSVLDGLDGIEVGDELIVITWLHEARRDVLKTHPRGDTSVPLAGVFATRSPDRPNRSACTLSSSSRSPAAARGRAARSARHLEGTRSRQLVREPDDEVVELPRDRIPRVRGVLRDRNGGASQLLPT